MEEFKESRNIFKFLSGVLCAFALSMIIMITLVLLVGEDAKAYSSIFQLGSQGIALSTLLQFLLAAGINTVIGWIFAAESVFPRVSAVGKQLLIIGSNGIIVMLFVYIFEWFPIDMWQAWVGFVVCFCVCTAAAILVMFLKTRIENKWFEESLRKYHEKEEK